jgi:phosphomethylpyrimidine synthase
MPMLGVCSGLSGIHPGSAPIIGAFQLNANPKFLAATAEVDAAAVAPLPMSRKIYETGSRPDIKVPFREISQGDTPTSFSGEKNPPLTVYDCSGPYTDPSVKIDIRRGLPELRRTWIEERNDTELLAGPTSDYGKERLSDPKLTAMRFDLRRHPRRAKAGANVSQMHAAPAPWAIFRCLHP